LNSILLTNASISSGLKVAEQTNPLQQSVQFLKGVGPARAEVLRKLDIETVHDLLFHFPRSYDDLSDVRPLDQLTAGAMQTVHGEVVEIQGRELADGRCIVGVVLSDGRNCVEGIWFNQPYAARHFRYGQRLAFSGTPQWHRDHWQIPRPRVHSLDGGPDVGRDAIVPVYPLTEELRADHLRALIRQAVDYYAEHLIERLPDEIRRRHGLPSASQAMRWIHAPASVAEATAARRRFTYENFLILQLALALRRRDIRDRQQAPRLPTSPLIDARIRRLFPFRLTPDQDKAVAEICKDLAGDRPMQRLLQADVGAGKTAVAVYALLVTIANKHQAALMAPTEVLALQHWQTLESYLSKSRVRRLLLTGALTSKERQSALKAIRDAEVDLVVGTQALVQADVQFARLGLVIIDEQHRFGVQQRARVRQLGVDPHYLVMTATPIPRTVALTFFGDLDVSTIRQPPPGRLPVKTRWVPGGRREAVYEALRKGLSEGRQAYVVCPQVATESLEQKAAEQTYATLQAGPFRSYRLGLLHGRLDEAVKEQTMDRFRAGEIQLLVCTTVVEVGVDVPNATLLIIEHAERFGLSQLHQLRGRISRGTVSGECYLFAEPSSEDAKQRLHLFTTITDGFALAEKDTQLRGVGEFFGSRQHGVGEFPLEQLRESYDLLRLARKDAFQIVAHDPGLERPEHVLLRQAVLERYGRTLDLARVG
jgi:ATP-dependent DNA helicase RecG